MRDDHRKLAFLPPVAPDSVAFLQRDCMAPARRGLNHGQAGCRVTTRRHQPRTLANINRATMVASDSMINRGVSTLSFPQVIFSLGTAPEYEPKLVVESLIWQK